MRTWLHALPARPIAADGARRRPLSFRGTTRFHDKKRALVPVITDPPNALAEKTGFPREPKPPAERAGLYAKGQRRASERGITDQRG
jgi:hypothetical protein